MPYAIESSNDLSPLDRLLLAAFLVHISDLTNNLPIIQLMMKQLYAPGEELQPELD